MDRMPTVAIIGAGFSGVMTAVHLLNAPKEERPRVILINRNGRMARGVAYGTRSSAHLLNVPAARMSAFPDEPNHFLHYAQKRNRAVTATTFLPRSFYGEYLEDTLEDAIGTSEGYLQQVVTEVTSVDVADNQVQLQTRHRQTITADRIVLALGNYPPRNPIALDNNVSQSPRYIRDPWGTNALSAVDLDAPILLVGTGLTMIDVALDLKARGAVGPVTAISRHGFLPQSHQPSVAATSAHRPPSIETGPATARAYLTAVRSRIEEMESQSICWRTVVDSLRPVTAQLWQRLPVEERSRFLRWVKAYWEVVRHRAAASPHQQVQEAISSGWLNVQAARIESLQCISTGLQATIRRRGVEESELLEVGTVINCTGPSSDIRRIDDPLMIDLQDQGLVQADSLGLGMEVASNGAVIDSTGEPSNLLYYIGPLGRAGYWERTAVPELRVLARDLATTVAVSLASARNKPEKPSPKWMGKKAQRVQPPDWVI
jgi:uncharacterized NAD(P)/FAD-binding protein YdhS